MTWHLTKIPKILHCYWGGNSLPYLRYLTIDTFHRLNPDWQIRYYYPINPKKEHSWVTTEQKYKETWDNWIDKIDTSYVSAIGISFEDAKKNMSEVHRSDYLRWQLLSGLGGLWSDMDILYVKPMEALYVNTEENSDKETVVCISGYGHSVGFMMGSRRNVVFKTMADKSLASYSSNQYQCMGSVLFNKLYPNIELIPRGINLSMDVVYAYDANHVRELFSDNRPNRFTNNTIGVHWYAGSHISGAYLNKTNGGLNPTGDSIIDRSIRNEG